MSVVGATNLRDSKELFIVFDNNDIAQMIQTLFCAFNDIPLLEDYEVI